MDAAYAQPPKQETYYKQAEADHSKSRCPQPPARPDPPPPPVVAWSPSALAPRYASHVIVHATSPPPGPMPSPSPTAEVGGVINDNEEYDEDREEYVERRSSLRVYRLEDVSMTSSISDMSYQDRIVGVLGATVGSPMSNNSSPPLQEMAPNPLSPSALRKAHRAASVWRKSLPPSPYRHSLKPGSFLLQMQKHASSEGADADIEDAGTQQRGWF